jgi:uncharacterized repeat protein (TIGR03803 family)
MRFLARLTTWFARSAMAVAAVLPASTAHANGFRVLYTFLGGSDGQNPAGPLLRDHTGNLYGTTSAGGGANACSGGCGTVFKLAPDGTETVLHAFAGGSDGSSPLSGVIADKVGNLYGTTEYGGGNTCWNSTCGAVFKLAPDGSETVLYAFTGQSDGANPAAGLIADRKGNLYGTTKNGGNTTNSYYGCGTVYRLTPGGSFRVLYTFAGDYTDGCNPTDPLIRDEAGNFYGTTNSGDYAQNGVIFELSPRGTETLLYELSGGVGGGSPRAGLLMDSSGNLYGTSSSGDEYLYGAVFKLAPNGTLTSLYAFSGGRRDGESPDGGVVMDAGGDLYGTTDQGGADDGGTVFKIATDGKFTIPHSFTGANDGARPDNTLIIDEKGDLYGTAVTGGSNTCSYGCGTVFKILANPPSRTPGAVIISSASTQNMSCSGGVCQPTNKNAVLNAGDLQSMLASGSVEVTTTGSGVQADDIKVEARIGWSTASALALEAKNAIAIDSPILVRNGGGLTFVTGGAETKLFFARKGHVTFKSLKSTLVINGNTYVLANTLPALAADVSANEYGYFALASSYDASRDGTYDTAPISEMNGSLEGLGNVISNLTIADTQSVSNGLVGINGGIINNLGLTNANISGSGNAGSTAGAFVGFNLGTLAHCHATGEISGSNQVGGLVGDNGTVSYCTSSVTVSGGKVDGGIAADSGGVIEYSSATGQIGGTVDVGGLVGDAQGGTYRQSFATGTVTGGNNANVGGLVGELVESALITASYATGAVAGGQNANVGGVVGKNYYGYIEASYSTGAVTGQTGSYLGGLIGYDQSSARELVNTYWDTTTSGITNLSQGAGNVPNDPGIEGLSSTQLQSGLPQGFRREIWKEKMNINNGFPYLIANAPVR